MTHSALRTPVATCCRTARSPWIARSWQVAMVVQSAKVPCSVKAALPAKARLWRLRGPPLSVGEGYPPAEPMLQGPDRAAGRELASLRRNPPDGILQRIVESFYLPL